MLNRKKKKITVPTIETTQVTVPTLHGIKAAVVPAVAGAAAAAKHWGDERAHEADEWAKPRLEQGRERAQAAAGALAERSEEARHRIESDAPKLTETVSGLLASGAATREEAQTRAADALKVLKGEATAKEKKKGVFGNILAALGILAVAGAIAAVVAKRQAQPKDDPWARPLTDPYIAGKTTSVGPAAGAAAVGDQAGQTDLTPGATTTNTAAGEKAEPAVSDVPVAEIDATPPASVEETGVVDLTAGGMPPASENDKGRS